MKNEMFQFIIYICFLNYIIEHGRSSNKYSRKIQYNKNENEFSIKTNNVWFINLTFHIGFHSAMLFFSSFVYFHIIRIKSNNEWQINA